jgi:hypothetical protein
MQVAFQRGEFNVRNRQCVQSCQDFGNPLVAASRFGGAPGHRPNHSQECHRNLIVLSSYDMAIDRFPVPECCDLIPVAAMVEPHLQDDWFAVSIARYREQRGMPGIVIAL